MISQYCSLISETEANSIRNREKIRRQRFLTVKAYFDYYVKKRCLQNGTGKETDEENSAVGRADCRTPKEVHL